MTPSQLLPALVLTSLLASPAAHASIDAAAVLADIDAATLDVAAARQIDRLHLDTGIAQWSLTEGTLFPVTTPDGVVVEMVFIGEGSVRVEPEDDIEAGQLDLFTGAPVLDERFEEAVFAFASDGAAAALLSRPIHEASEETVRQARERLAAWQSSPVRDVLDVETGIALDRIGDPLFQNYLAAWFLGETLGELTLSYHPESFEQLKLGRFEPLELDAKEQRRFDRALGRQQRKGRFLGLESDDLGTWDNWLSASGRRDGAATPGFFAFEPTHVAIQAVLEPRDEILRATVRVDLAPRIDSARSVGFTLPGDFLIDGVRDGAGSPLVYRRVRDQLRVFLPSPADGPRTVEIEYHGKGLTGASKAWIPIDNLNWYPRTGDIDRSTYDLEIAWPKKYQLLASGRLLAEERRGDQRWQKRRLEQPGLGVSFALGKFKVIELDVDGLEVTLALDDNLIAARRWDWEEIDDAVVSATRYFIETFGPLERRQLTLVTVPSYVSQSLPGFIHLSNLVLAAPRSFSTYNDARMLIAHEISHQWWGNAIGWKTYRDQWFTEAMADYSALLWARNGADPEMNLPSRPKNDWQTLLTQKLRDGRPVESVGPLVLGQRLQSSLSPNAYSSIVYSKGAVVIDMLACFWTEETFVEILGHFVRAANGHALSTEDFFDVLERLTGASLQPFADRFVFATGLPEIYYDFSFESLDDGRTRVQLEAEQELPYRLEHAIVEAPWGLDVRSTAVQQLEDQVIPLVVPFQIRLTPEDPTDEKIHTMNGRIQLTEQRTELSFEIEPSPERLRLDEEGQVFGRFFNQQVSPKRTGLFRASSLVRSGEFDAARERLVELLDIRTPVPEGRDPDRFAEWDRVTDWWIRLRLADVELATGHLDAAARHVEAAGELAKRDRSLRSGQRLYEAHVALLEGDVDSAYRQLKRVLRRLGKRASVPTRMLTAIAAWRTGRHDEAREILDALDGTGADVELLDQRLSGDSG